MSVGRQWSPGLYNHVCSAEHGFKPEGYVTPALLLRFLSGGIHTYEKKRRQSSTRHSHASSRMRLEKNQCNNTYTCTPERQRERNGTVSSTLCPSGHHVRLLAGFFQLTSKPPLAASKEMKKWTHDDDLPSVAFDERTLAIARMSRVTLASAIVVVVVSDAAMMGWRSERPTREKSEKSKDGQERGR